MQGAMAALLIFASTGFLVYLGSVANECPEHKH